MRITRETLIRIAKETAQKQALSDPELVAAYLTGSLRSEDPFINNSTDIDIVFVHAGQPRVRREIVAVTPEISLDIVHNPRSEYEKPKELRVHPWLGPELYDPLPLHVSHHFFEFVQAGVRAEYDEPSNLLARARKNADHARQIWSGLRLDPLSGPARILSFLKSVNHAANAVAVLTGAPLAERRFISQFQERSAAVGIPELSARLLDLLGGVELEAATLGGFLPDWEQAFLEASGKDQVYPGIATPRLAYYRLAFEAMLASDFPQSILYPLLHTWSLCATVLPVEYQTKWSSACETLGFSEASFGGRLEGLDHFLDTVDELLEKIAVSQGV